MHWISFYKFFFSVEKLPSDARKRNAARKNYSSLKMFFIFKIVFFETSLKFKRLIIVKIEAKMTDFDFIQNMSVVHKILGIFGLPMAQIG